MALHSAVCVILLILVAAAPCAFTSPAVIETPTLSAFVGRCVEIKCKVTGDLVDEDALFFWMKDGTWDKSQIGDFRGTTVYSNKPDRLPISEEFRARATYTGSTRLSNRASSSSNPSCSVTICDLREQDSGSYFFRYIPNNPNYKWRTYPNVNLTVKVHPCAITFTKPAAGYDGRTLTLECSTPRTCSLYLEIQSVPPSGLRTYQSSIGYTATAEFRPSWRDDNREFTCQTRGNNDPQLVKKIRISVQYAPRDTVAVINSADVKEGQSVTLSCSAQGQPPPTFTWYKTIQRRSITHTGAIWTINSAQTHDSGEYVCTAQNKHGTELSRHVKIDVQYGPSVELRVSPQAPYTEGQRLTLTCEVLQSNPYPFSFTWFKDELRLHTTVYNTKYMTVEPGDSGSYSCSAQNSVSTANSGPKLIEVQYKPRNTNIQIVDKTTNIAAGRAVVFTCITDANPHPETYKWYRDYTFHQSTNENSLELKNVQSKDEGCYHCRATNKIGTGSFSEKLCIKVLYPPTNLVLCMDTEVTEGQRVSISCRVDSSPAASLTLSRISQGSTEELQKTTGSNSLSFSVTVSSAHSGQYICSAQNSVGSKSTQRSLRVKYGPKEVRVQADPGLTVKENMTLSLRCSAQSDPPVSLFSWSRGPAGQERHVHTGPVYTVESVSVSDTGLYSCTAHHPIRNQTSPPAQVQVQFGPKQVVVLRAEEEQGPDGSRSVTLSCSGHSFPPSIYTWYRSTEGRATKVSESINYTVPSTQPGLYYCTAMNEVSQSTSDPVSLFQQQGLGGYINHIISAVKVVLIVLLPVVFYRLVRDLQELQIEDPTSNNCHVGERNRSSRGKQTQGQGLNQDLTFFEETGVYENINERQSETCPQLMDRREELVNIDVCRALVSYSTTAPDKEEEERAAKAPQTEQQTS